MGRVQFRGKEGCGKKVRRAEGRENWLEGKVSPRDDGSNLGSATHLKRTIPRLYPPIP